MKSRPTFVIVLALAGVLLIVYGGNRMSSKNSTEQSLPSNSSYQAIVESHKEMLVGNRIELAEWATDSRITEYTDRIVVIYRSSDCGSCLYETKRMIAKIGDSRVKVVAIDKALPALPPTIITSGNHSLIRETNARTPLVLKVDKLDFITDIHLPDHSVEGIIDMERFLLSVNYGR